LTVITDTNTAEYTVKS